MLWNCLKAGMRHWIVCSGKFERQFMVMFFKIKCLTVDPIQGGARQGLVGNGWSYCQVWCMTTGSSSGVPADFAFIYSVDELHAGNDIGQLPEAPQSAPAFLRAHGQLMHQGHAAFGAVAISGLGRSESNGRKGRLDRIGCPQVLPVGGREVVEGQQAVTV